MSLHAGPRAGLAWSTRRAGADLIVTYGAVDDGRRLVFRSFCRRSA